MDVDEEAATVAVADVKPDPYADDTDADGNDDMDVDVPYIDRIVEEVENVGEDDEEDDWGEDYASDSSDVPLSTLKSKKKAPDDGNAEDGDEGGEGSKEDNPAGKGKENEESDDEFEYDSDESEFVVMDQGYKPPTVTSGMSEESREQRAWGTDKETTLLHDWTIEVTAAKEDGSNSTETYYVHRYALAVGPKKSGYFAALFTSEQFDESNSATSKVTLSEAAASHFADFLDYIYCLPHDADCVVTKENWRSLHYLADYFVVPTLIDAIGDFLKQDMRNLEHCEEYLADIDNADEGANKMAIVHATRACTEMILSIDLDSSLYPTMSPAMFLQVIGNVRSSSKIKSLPSNNQNHICRMVVKYLKTHKGILDGDYFDALTRQLYFPDHIYQAGILAIDLLEMMEQTGWGQGQYGIECVCTAALSRYLAHSAGPDIAQMEEITRKIPKGVCAKLLMEAICARRVLSGARQISNISCRIMNIKLGVPEGSVVKVSVKSTDSVNTIRYFVCRQLNLMPGCPSTGHKVRVLMNGIELEGEQIVSKCSITASTVLDIL